jgi:hypothetical protein
MVWATRHAAENVFLVPSRHTSSASRSCGQKISGESGSKIVAMMQATQSQKRPNLAGIGRVGFLHASSGHFFHQTKICATFMDCSDVIAQQPFKITPVQRDNMIEQIAMAATGGFLRCRFAR